jgi:hypothetical protein
VAAITRQLISDNTMRNVTVNIANPVNYPMMDIVHSMEKAVGKRAVCNVLERGSGYPIDIHMMLPVVDAAGVKFGTDYLERVIGKYYG